MISNNILGGFLLVYNWWCMHEHTLALDLSMLLDDLLLWLNLKLLVMVQFKLKKLIRHIC